ncbi:MAG: ABC transporter ATP-binding protein [bacterium]
MKSQTLKTIKFVFSQAKYKWTMGFVAVFMLIYVAADFVNPFVYRGIINAVSENNFQPIVFLVLILAIALLVHRIFRDIASLFLIRIEAGTMEKIGNRAFNHVAKLPYKFHTSTFAGSNARKIHRGIGMIETILDMFFYDLTPITLTMIFVILVLVKTNVLIGALLGIGLIIFIILSILLVKKQIKLEARRTKRENILSGTIIDSLSNNLTVKTFTGEKAESKIFGKDNMAWAESAKKCWTMGSLISLFQGSFIAFLEVMLLAISLYFWKQGAFNVGDIVFVQGNMGLLMFPMWTFGRFYRHFRRAEVDIQDLIKLLEKPLIIKSPKNAPILKIKKGEIKFENICFAYARKNKYALKNINLLIKPGEKIALVGPSGAGKSTFIKLLFRFVDPQKGKILIDGQNIKKVDLESLRKSISLVPQEPLLFHRSIYQNIKYGKKNAQKSEIIKAAKLAYADEFIQDLPKKYKSMVGERGIKLSGGERQRIALARVFLENAQILILDEATSSLDSVSENLIQQALDSLMQNRTTIIIAHRLSTIRKMDKIIVFEKGQIIEAGSHEELLSNSELYQKLWKSQVSRFID